jgi:hypothetical protein
MAGGSVFDLRGLQRVVNGKIDIGAFQNQSQQFTLTPPPSTAPVAAGSAVAFNLGSLTYSGGSSSLSVDVNWGDGTPDTVFPTTNQGILDGQNHTYTTVGSKTVTVTVSDVDNNFVQTRFAVQVVDFAETFNRVNAPTLGSNWQLPPLPEKFHFTYRRRLGFGGFQLQGGKAVSVGTSLDGGQVNGQSLQNPTLQADVSLGGSQAVGLMARVQSNGDAYVAVLTSAGYLKIWLFHEANNTYTELASSASPVVDTSGTLQFVVNGPSLTLTLTGSGVPIVVTANDPTLAAAGGVGIFGWGLGGTVDNFSVSGF